MNERDDRKLTAAQITGVIVLSALVFGALIFALATLPSCDEKGVMEKIAPALGDLAVSAFADTRSDPAVLAAYTADGWDGVKQAAPQIFLTNLKNRALEYGMSDDKLERAAYEYLRDEWPTAALMVYRDGALGPEGIWPRLDALAKSHGYPGASLSLLAQITPAQRDWLLQRAPLVVAEEYAAVTGAHADAPPSAGIREEEWTK